MYLRLARLRRLSPRLGTRTADRITTLYVDREDWAIRFLLIGVHDPPRSTAMDLVSPLQIERVDLESESVEFSTGGADPYRVSNGDRYQSLAPHEVGSISRHYGLPVFWEGSGVWGEYGSPGELRAAVNGHPSAREFREPGPELFPHTILMGRPVFCPDGRLGVISDLLLDVTAWRVRYLIVWLQAPGETGEILLSPYWVSGAPERSQVTVPMTTEAIVSAPTFTPEELEPIDEQILARYFGFLKE